MAERACGSSTPWTKPASTAQDGADFAVHVALWQRSAGPAGALTDAVVDVPALGELWRTDQPRPAHALPLDRALRIVVSRSRPPAGLSRLLEDVSADLADAGITSRGIEAANVGSVGAKLGEVMAGRAQVYLHPGGLNEWDLAAPHACALAAGLVALGPETALQPDAAEGRPRPDLPPRPGRGLHHQLALTHWPWRARHTHPANPPTGFRHPPRPAGRV